MPGNAMKPISTLADIRLRCRMDEVGDCWLWVMQGAKDGTPRMWASAELLERLGMKPAHLRGRIVWTQRTAVLLSGRKIPDGHVVWRAYCKTPNCVNPEHMRVGTPQQLGQWQRRTGAVRTPVKQAQARANAALKAIPVEAVRRAEELLAAGLTIKQVSDELRATPETVRRIRDGVHVHQRPPEARMAPTASVFSWGLTHA